MAINCRATGSGFGWPWREPKLGGNVWAEAFDYTSPKAESARLGGPTFWRHRK